MDVVCGYSDCFLLQSMTASSVAIMSNGKIRNGGNSGITSVPVIWTVMVLCSS